MPIVPQSQVPRVAWGASNHTCRRSNDAAVWIGCVRLCVAVPNKQRVAKRHRHRHKHRQLGHAPLKEPVEVPLAPTQALETEVQASKKKKQGAGESFSDGDSPRAIVQHIL